MKMTRSERFSVWIIKHTPNVLITDPERFVLAAIQTAIGVIAFVTALRPPSVEGVWPVELSYSWGLTLVLGGLATIIGIARDRPLTDRLGQALILLASLVYLGVATIFYGGVGENTFGLLVFLGFGWAAVTRLVIRKAVHVSVRARLEGESE